MPAAGVIVEQGEGCMYVKVRTGGVTEETAWQMLQTPPV